MPVGSLFINKEAYLIRALKLFPLLIVLVVGRRRGLKIYDLHTLEQRDFGPTDSLLKSRHKH